MTWFVFKLSGEKIGQISVEEDLTIDEVMKKAKRKFRSLQASMILSDEPKIHQHRVEKKTNPFLDKFIPGASWVDGLKTYGSTYSGFSQAR